MNKTDWMKVRLTPEEKLGFETAAKVAGISLSAWMRERLRLAAIRELQGSGQIVPFIAPVTLRG